MRRANNSGGVHKLPGNRRKPWQARITIGYDEYGKQLYKNIGYYATKAEAENAIALDRVMPVSEQANISLAALFEQWKKTRAYLDISYKTQESYDVAFRYMKRYEKTPFRDLRTPHFQDMIDVADAMGRSRSTMAKIRTLQGILSNYALSQDIIMKTYHEQVRLPKLTKKQQIPTFTDTEIQKLFKNDSLPLADAALILIYTGMRISELLTLTKFNVDIQNMLITGGIKTEAGTDRIIPIHPKIQKYIKARYESSMNYLIEYDKEVGKRGEKQIKRVPYRKEYFRDVYYSTLDTLGIRRLSPHKARHTFFTMMSTKCKDKKAMALVGGHTDPNFSTKVYDQPDIERLRKAIESI
jgi:integrase